MDAVAEELLAACAVVDGEGLTDAFGHVSTRLGADELLISPKLGPGMTRSTADFIRLGIETGEHIGGDLSLMPAEAPIHRGVYRHRRGVNAVCRFHGAACMAWATLGKPLPMTVGPALALGGPVPVHATTKTVVTDEEADELAETLGEGTAVLLRGFGAVTTGRSIPEAVIRAWAMERAAAAVLAASAVAEPLTYPQEVADELMTTDPVLVGQIQRAWNYLCNRHARPAAAVMSTTGTAAGTQPTESTERQEGEIDLSEGSIWLEFAGGGVSERFYDAGGVRTRVLEAGDESAPVLILLHGTGGHAESYYRNLVELGKHFRVLSVDMVGHGYSDRPDLEYSLDDFAGHIADLLDAIGTERAHISGESLGSAVAAWFAITMPERVDRLVLNTAVLALPTEEGLAELEEFARRTIEVMSSGLTLDAVRTRMEWLLADPGRMSEELVRTRHAIYTQPGMVETIGKVMMSVGGMFRGVSNQQYFEPGVMGRIQAPTLVLWTEHNPGQNAEFAREIAADIPDHKFTVLTDCGHWPQYEDPDTFNRTLVEFLTADERAAAA